MLEQVNGEEEEIFEQLHITTFNNNKYLTVVEYSPISQCKFVYFHPIRLIHKPIYNIFKIIIFVSLLIIVTVIAVSFIFSKSFTNPIYELTKAANKISNADYGINAIKIKSKNELSILGDTFNLMAKEIKDYTENLELKVSERTEELNKINIELKEKSDFKSKYLANMSHEIRTPLNSILGFNQLLLYRNYDMKDDIVEINDEILELLNGKEEFKELNVICNNFKNLLSDNDIDMKQFYHLLISGIINKSGNTNCDPVIMDTLKSLSKEIEEVLLHENSKIKRNLLNSRESGNYLLKLIDTVLDISKVEADKVEINLGEIKIKDYIEELIDVARSYQKSKKKRDEITIESIIKASVPEHLILDKSKIKQVLLNLLSNSIKFTKEGEVTLIVDIINDVPDQRIQFTVKDTGVGIKKDEIDLLFKEFGRTSSTKDIEGTGLGLALSKKIVELHKGTIEVKSEYGTGSEFIIYLPMNSD